MTVRIATVQAEATPGDLTANGQAAARWVDLAAAQSTGRRGFTGSVRTPSAYNSGAVEECSLVQGGSAIPFREGI